MKGSNFYQKYVLALAITICCGSALYAQEHLYSVHRSGKEIGEISATLTETTDTETYEILSDVSFKVLWKQYRRKTSNRVVYQGESMKTSHSGVYMNNNLQDSTTMHKEQDSYRVYKHPDDQYQLDNTDLHFTTAKLYFHEPVGIQQVYSERYLQQCRLEQQGGHTYKLHLPDNKANYYTYKDRQLVVVSVERTWFNLEFRKK